ncbi:MAG: hypothetical protein QM484_07045 [Woeseiaceae bacterium]
MYLISALLFLTSIELHIHTLETAATAEHGSAVSISSLSSDILSSDIDKEIKVSPDGALKIKYNSFNFIAIFLIIALFTLYIRHSSFITRIRKVNSLLPSLPFHGTPTLRAPPL